MKERYYEVDLARCFFILVLPLVHIYEYWGSWGEMADILKDPVSQSLSGLICFLTIFGAPTFMVCMGMNMVWTKHNSPKSFAIRGLELLFLELIFNLIRYALPGMIGVAIGGVETEEASTTLWWMIYGLINSDILAFAGLAFLVFALFRMLKLKPYMIMIIAVFCLVLDGVLASTVGPMLDGSCNYFFCELLDNIFYVNADSTFSLLSWLIFPAWGYCMASLFEKKQASQRNRLWSFFGFISAIVLAVVIAACVIRGWNPLTRLNVTECNNRLDLFCAAGELAAAVLFICICHGIYKYLHLDEKTSFNHFVRRYSNGITANYIIQWTIVGWVLFITCGVGVWGCKSINMPEALIFYVVIEILSYFGSQWRQSLKRK